MKTIEETLSRAADEVRQKVAQVPARRPGTAPAHLRAVRVAQVGALVAVVLSLAALLFILDPGSSPRSFVAPPSEPEREADLFIWFPSDVESVDAELAVAEVATWEGVEYASFWGPVRTRQEFSEMFAEQPSLIAVVEQDPSVLPASVRIWLAPGADRDALAQRARQTFVDAVGVGTRDEGDIEAGIVAPGATTANGESAVTTIAVPTQLEPTGTALQNEILADGQVSRDEFVRAVSRMAACMTENGLTGVTWSVDADGGGWSNSYISPAGDAAEQAIESLCYYSYVDRVGGNQWGPTEFPAEVAAFLPVLEELDAQVLTFINRANQIESDWENRQATFANTTSALYSLRIDLDTWFASLAQRTDVPSELGSSYAALIDEASDLPAAVEAILLGVQAPDDGTQRRTAVNAFVQEALDVVYAIDTLRGGG
jgi:hypothetical protein